MAEKTAQPPAKKQQPSELALYKVNVIDKVADKVRSYVESGALALPKDYSPDNAMKSAWLILQQTVDKNKKQALAVCTRDSVANALLDMVVQGLNPGKKQGYFIVYGDKLVFQRSYFGSMAVARNVEPVIPEHGFCYAVVYEGDEFKYEIVRGNCKVTKHEQTLENVNKDKIKAAYCEVYDREGIFLGSELMTYEQIKQAWSQSITKPIDEKGNVRPDSTHGKFPADMALRTVINKVCKVIINSSSDSALLLDSIKRSEDLADQATAQEEIDANANIGEELTVETTITDNPPDSDGKKETASPESIPSEEAEGESNGPGDRPPASESSEDLYDSEKCGSCLKLKSCPWLKDPTAIDNCPGVYEDPFKICENGDKGPCVHIVQCKSVNKTKAMIEACQKYEGPKEAGKGNKSPGF